MNRKTGLFVRIHARLHDDERGFSLIETVIAVTVIFGSLITLAMSASTGFRYVGIGREQQAANQVANQLMEQARGLAFSKIQRGMQATGPVDRSEPRHRVRGRRHGHLPAPGVHGGQGRLHEPQLPDGHDRLLRAVGPELGHRRRDAGLPRRLHLALVRHEQLSGGGDGLSRDHAVQGHDLRHVDRRGHLVHGGAGRHDAEPVPFAERDASTPPPTRSRHRASRSSTARPWPRPASSRSRGPCPGSTSRAGPC